MPRSSRIPASSITLHCRLVALPFVMLLLTGGSLAVSLPIDHSKWDAMLKKYVDVQALVDYRKWNETGKPDVETYLAQLARPWRAGMSPEEEKSALINAYNALTVEWVLQNFPITSIWRTDHPFAAARHTVNGRDISLNQIESRLRAAGDPRIHAALVCASRSCPPVAPGSVRAGPYRSTTGR